MFAAMRYDPNSFNHMTRSEEHTSELQSPCNLVCRLLLEKKINELSHHFATARCGVLKVRRLRLCRSREALAARAGLARSYICDVLFFFNDTATTEIYTLSLHDALPISASRRNNCSKPAFSTGAAGC